MSFSVFSGFFSGFIYSRSEIRLETKTCSCYRIFPIRKKIFVISLAAYCFPSICNHFNNCCVYIYFKCLVVFTTILVSHDFQKLKKTQNNNSKNIFCLFVCLSVQISIGSWIKVCQLCLVFWQSLRVLLYCKRLNCIHVFNIQRYFERSAVTDPKWTNLGIIGMWPNIIAYFQVNCLKSVGTAVWAVAGSVTAVGYRYAFQHYYTCLL